uniref:Uncharacterized protein n=1 Tax=Parascaris equorum TaxID=6256 RepID=A0A914SJ84_PAREQ
MLPFSAVSSGPRPSSGEALPGRMDAMCCVADGVITAIRRIPKLNVDASFSGAAKLYVRHVLIRLKLTYVNNSRLVQIIYFILSA